MNYSLHDRSSVMIQIHDSLHRGYFFHMHVIMIVLTLVQVLKLFCTEHMKEFKGLPQSLFPPLASMGRARGTREHLRRPWTRVQDPEGQDKVISGAAIHRFLGQIPNVRLGGLHSSRRPPQDRTPYSSRGVTMRVARRLMLQEVAKKGKTAKELKAPIVSTIF